MENIGMYTILLSLFFKTSEIRNWDTRHSRHPALKSMEKFQGLVDAATCQVIWTLVYNPIKYIYMGMSINGVPPKWMVCNGKSN